MSKNSNSFPVLEHPAPSFTAVEASEFACRSTSLRGTGGVLSERRRLSPSSALFKGGASLFTLGRLRPVGATDCRAGEPLHSNPIIPLRTRRLERTPVRLEALSGKKESDRISNLKKGLFSGFFIRAIASKRYDDRRS